MSWFKRKYYSSRMSMSKKKWLVCFNRQTGDMMLNLNGNSSNELTIEKWKSKFDTRDPDSQFFATLRFVGADIYDKTVWWKDTETGVRYPMFTNDLFMILKGVDIYQGELTGKFGFVKFGQKCGIKLLEEVKFDTEGQVAEVVKREDRRYDMYKSIPTRLHANE